MGGKYVQQFKKGSLELILLCIMGEKESYGYEIITRLNSKSDVLGIAKEGTVYPILYRLEESGLVSCKTKKSESGMQRKYYSLTQKGEELLNELKAYWREYSMCVDSFIGDQNEKFERQV